MLMHAWNLCVPCILETKTNIGISDMTEYLGLIKNLFFLFYAMSLFTLQQISYAKESDSVTPQTEIVTEDSSKTESVTESEQAISPVVTAANTVEGEQTEKPAVAPNVDLKEVAPPPEPVVTSPEAIEKEPEKAATEKQSPAVEEQKTSKPDVAKTTEIDSSTREKLIILGSEVPAGTSTRLAWSPQISISGLSIPTPVLVINGKKPGPSICLTSAIHGDELNGIEVVRRVMYDINPEKFNGTLIGVPIVNLQGFQRGSRYLSDRRDLNRYFPGAPDGSLASRIAYSLFTEVISHCEYLIDIHTGSLRRTNLPQIRADMSNEKVAKFVESFDKIAVVHHRGNPGMLRTAANEANIVAITMELGESLRIQENQIVAGTYAVNSILDRFEMYPRMFIWGDSKPAYYESVWLRVESGGILFSEADIGDNVTQGDLLGVVTDPITNKKTELTSPVAGNIIGMAVNQVVVPGFAAYHIGIESTQEAMAKSHDETEYIEDIEMDGEVIDPE